MLGGRLVRYPASSAAAFPLDAEPSFSLPSVWMVSAVGAACMGGSSPLLPALSAPAGSPPPPPR